MKTKIFYLFILLLNAIIIHSQNNDSIQVKPHKGVSFEIAACYTPVLEMDFYGINFDFKYYFKKRWATGLSFSAADKKTDNNFGFEVEKPIIELYEFGWINQYEIVQQNRLRINFNLNNGLVLIKLGDNATKESYWTEYGEMEKTRKVAINCLYLLQPGIDASLKLFSIKKTAGVYLTSKAKYRFVFGNCKFANTDDFSNYYAGLGFSFIIF